MEYQRVPIQGKAVVVAFDMSSSSNIIEELTLLGALQQLKDFLIKLKRYLASAQKSVTFALYKFTGDGWILLFPENTDGKVLFEFLQNLCTFFQKEFQRDILKYLGSPPSITGLTFGLEMGPPLVPMKIFGQQEYIGRALNVAVGCKARSDTKINHLHIRLWCRRAYIISTFVLLAIM
jgi:hypothetical protein